MRRFLRAVLFIIIAFIAGLILGQFSDKFSFIDSSKSKVTVQSIQEQVADIAEIASVQDTITDEYYFEQDGIKIKNFKVPFTSKQLVVSCDTIVKLGSDLTDIQVDLNGKGTKAIVTIPHAKILSCEIDENSWEVQSHKDGLFNKVTVEDDDQLRKTIKKEVKKHVKERGLYDQADANTVTQITKYLQASNPDLEVEVVFK